MTNKRERIGHRVSYRVDFFVPDSDADRAQISCQHWLDHHPVPDGYKKARWERISLKLVKEVLAEPEWPRTAE